MVSLPPEILLLVVRNLSNTGLVSLRSTCRYLKQIVDSPAVVSLCQERTRAVVGPVPPQQVAKDTVTVLSDLAVVITTCKWLASGISTYLATCLPPELQLGSTAFRDRIEHTLRRDVWETHKFLEQLALQTSRDRSSDVTCDHVHAARDKLGLSSLDTASRTFFIIADVMREAIEMPDTKKPSQTIAVARDVLIRLLQTHGLRQAIVVTEAPNNLSRIAALQKLLPNEVEIRQQSVHYRQPIPRHCLHLMEPEDTLTFSRLLKWCGPSEIRTGERLCERIFRALRK